MKDEGRRTKDQGPRTRGPAPQGPFVLCPSSFVLRPFLPGPFDGDAVVESAAFQVRHHRLLGELLEIIARHRAGEDHLGLGFFDVQASQRRYRAVPQVVRGLRGHHDRIHDRLLPLKALAPAPARRRKRMEPANTNQPAARVEEGVSRSGRSFLRLCGASFPCMRRAYRSEGVRIIVSRPAGPGQGKIERICEFSPQISNANSQTVFMGNRYRDSSVREVLHVPLPFAAVALNMNAANCERTAAWKNSGKPSTSKLPSWRPSS